MNKILEFDNVSRGYGAGDVGARAQRGADVVSYRILIGKVSDSVQPLRDGIGVTKRT